MRATACTGAACRVEGSIPHQYLSERAKGRELIEIGHPSGIIRVESRLDGDTVAVARIFRTARRLAEGTVYLRGQPR
jgi:2-methylaconitate cis-trans-isomerase PrpF